MWRGVLQCFFFIVASGIYLTFFFQASDHPLVYHGAIRSLDGRTMSAAYASVLKLSFETQVGLFVRQAHHWCALVFAAAVVAHLARVFFTGAFRRPRDLNWFVGLTLLLLVMADGFTGYSLPGDQLSGAGLRIAQSVMLAIPVLGDWVASLFFGGAFPSAEMTSRLFVIHVLLIPAALAALIGLHLAVLWRQKHTQFPGHGRTERNVIGSPLWPSYALKSVALMFAVFAILSLLGGAIETNPIWVYGPYDPSTVASPSQPDWYLGFLEGALRLGPALSARFFGHTISPLFWPALLLPALLCGLLYAWPALERIASGDSTDHHLLQFPHQAALRTGIGVALFTFGFVLLLAASDDVQARIMRISVQQIAWFYRIALLTLPLVFGAIAWRICREVGAREALEPEHPERVLIRRAPGGGYEEERRII